jgi:hypothetical protein
MTGFNPNIPKGLDPVQRLDDAKWNARLRKYYSPQAKTNALYVGDPVIKVTASADVNGVNGVDLALAASGDAVTGVVCGFLGVSTAGSGNTPSFYGLPTGPLYRPASTASDWYVLVDDSFEDEWIIQADNNYGGVIAVTFSASSAITGTGLPSTAGTPVAFSNSTASTDLPSPLVAYQTYYVLAGSTSTSITVAATPGGTAIVMAGAGTGSSYITSGVAPPVSIVGKNINLLPGTGNPYTGWSGWQASTGANYDAAGSAIAAPGTGSTLQLNVVGIYTDADNAAGNYFTKLIVRLNTATEITGQAGI